MNSIIPLTVIGFALALSACASPNLPSSLADNPNVPGATDYTIVPGDHSTVAGDRAATVLERTGQI
jgi:hypothetical protein